MGLLSRVYFNAVFGALGGLLGWLLFGVFGEKNPSPRPALGFLTHEDLNLLLGGSLIGGLIGYFIVASDAIRDQSVVRFARLASYGVVLGAIGGALGMWLGDVVNYGLQKWLGGWLIAALIARGLGWTLLGVAIGASEGIAARSMGKFSYGMLGGAIGGFLGGVVFELFTAAAQASLSTTYFWSALGLVILGACIGALSALVQGVFQPACVRVLRGWQEGREYPLDKAAVVLGRAEQADIALFRDMKVEKEHAVIRQEGEHYVLVNNGAPPSETRVNDASVPAAQALVDGDRIQLGNVVLKFQLRSAKPRAKRKD
jgi:MFS family permease